MIAPRALQPVRQDSIVPSVHVRNGIHVSRVISFAAMGGAAKAEETCGIGIGAMTEILDVADARSRKAGCDIAAKVKLRVARSRGRGKKPLVGFVLRRQRRDEFRSHLIAGLPDHRAKRRLDARAGST